MNIFPNQLPPSALEAGLLASLTSLDRLTKTQVSGVELSNFGVWGAVYTFQCEYAAKYSGLPSAELIKSRWEEWDPPLGEFDYWLEEFLKRSAAHKAEVLVRASMPKILEAPDLAIPELVAQLSSIQYHGNTHITATDTTVQGRLEKYQRRKKMFEDGGGAYLIGIDTGFDVINDTHQGWMPGELVGFYARPTVGKTWMLVREAAVAWARGYKVLLISPEVSAKHIALRVDVFLANQLGIPLSHRKIFEGNPSQLQSYQALADALATSERWWTVDSMQGRPLGLRDIRSLVHEFRPDLVCIDGIMLLNDDEKAKSSWERMDNVCYGLKNMATAEDIVIIVSHQAVNSAKGRRSGNDSTQGRGDDWHMPTLNDAAGGEGFARACSTVFTMAPDQNHRNLRWYSIRKSRERSFEEWKPRYAIGWDVDAGNTPDWSAHGMDLVRIEELLKTIGGA